VAPVITRDVRQLFEASGRATPNDWPKIAALLLQFCVRPVSKRPIRWLRLASDFTSETPAKGFQSGTLSPILNALRHDHFVVFNKKSREVLNYFTGSSFSTKLSGVRGCKRGAVGVDSRGFLKSSRRNLGSRSCQLATRYDMFCTG